MTDVVIALLVALSVATWLYTKFMRRSGNNTKNSVLTASFIGVIAFFVVLTIAKTIASSLE